MKVSVRRFTSSRVQVVASPELGKKAADRALCASVAEEDLIAFLSLFLGSCLQKVRTD
jgi:hypothetical protein